MVEHPVVIRHFIFFDDVCHDSCQCDRQFIRIWISQADGQASLGISIDHGDSIAFHCQTHPEIQRYRGLGTAPFLITDCVNLAHRSFPPSVQFFVFFTCLFRFYQHGPPQIRLKDRSADPDHLPDLVHCSGFSGQSDHWLFVQVVCQPGVAVCQVYR